MRYRLDVVAATVLDVVKSAGGWMYDRAMAGWDVTVLICEHKDDERPLQILGVVTADLEDALQLWAHRPHPQTVAVAADLLDSDERVRNGVLGALDRGVTEVSLWGQHAPAELDGTVNSVRHELSAAARAFKAQALAAAGDPDAEIVGHVETFRCGTMVSSPVTSDLVSAG